MLNHHAELIASLPPQTDILGGREGTEDDVSISSPHSLHVMHSRSARELARRKPQYTAAAIISVINDH